MSPLFEDLLEGVTELYSDEDKVEFLFHKPILCNMAKNLIVNSRVDNMFRSSTGDSRYLSISLDRYIRLNGNYIELIVSFISYNTSMNIRSADSFSIILISKKLLRNVCNGSYSNSSKRYSKLTL